ncbi:MAG: rod shape-determining protein MreC [Candidatus Electryonea clarkiae]|nr:rod shape-determining protein MreC [Candidatus Electryonea clarkiae]MDP8289105.1 rod shape-determining protein MreC [Candidatus Electryonea clarkiae]
MNLLVLLTKLKDWLALALALILSVILMNSSSYPAAEKFRFGLGRFISFVTTPITLIPRTITVWGENAELRAEIIRYATDRNRWRDAALENIRLRKMIGFRTRTDFQYIAADVIARNPVLNMSSLQLNKGSEDSVKTGQAVITPEGLVGVIHYSDKSASIAQLATDPNFAASVRVERSRIDGIVRWYMGEMLLIDGISKNQDVKEGDRIVTSGLGGVIPEGIPVGLITGITSSRGDIFLEVHVDPYVSFGRLEELFVLNQLQDNPETVN